MSERFPHLFSPFHFRPFEIRNRIVMPPMAIYIPGSGGFVHQRLIDYYEARAAGGVGLIIVNATYVHPNGSSHPNMTSITDDKFIPGFARLVDAIHRHGARTCLQLYHSGRQRYALVAGGQTISPSGIRCPVRKDPAHAPSVEEIRSLVEDYGQAARRAKAAGFDGIEIHCAHGYLLAGFLSPYQNKRTDEYGGDVSGRTRIVREILARCREAAGDDLLIGVRINGSDYVNDGNTPEEVISIARLLAQNGAEYVHVSAGMAASAQYTFLPSAIPRGFNVPLAERIREAVPTPVIACGAITDAEFAEGILRRGKVDLVAIGRPLMADPDLPIKARTGRLEETRPCLRCSKCAGVWPENMTCTVNPAMGREGEFRYDRAAAPKTVVVIGGGPAGLEAARTLALRGYAVRVIDRNERIGGQVRLAKRAPHKRDLERWITFYEHEMARLGVLVELGRTVSAADVPGMSADAVVVATGALPLVPKGIKGVDHPRVVLSTDVLWDRAEVGAKVLVVGGSSHGIETAEYIAAQGKKVVVCEMLHDILSDISHDAALALLDGLAKLDFTALTETEVVAIDAKDGVLDVRVRRYGMEAVLGGFDSVVLAVGVVPDSRLGLELRAKLDPVYLIGDCERGGDFRKAVHDGARVGMAI